MLFILFTSATMPDDVRWARDRDEAREHGDRDGRSRRCETIKAKHQIRPRAAKKKEKKNIRSKPQL
ncbi:hypothetical protein ACSS6W_007046 [Trichoderma asperelloides]